LRKPESLQGVGLPSRLKRFSLGSLTDQSRAIPTETALGLGHTAILLINFGSGKNGRGPKVETEPSQGKPTVARRPRPKRLRRVAKSKANKNTWRGFNILFARGWDQA
jgi:hypothetical protein